MLFENLATSPESTFSLRHASHTSMIRGKKRELKIAYLSERVNLGNLCLQHFVD